MKTSKTIIATLALLPLLSFGNAKKTVQITYKEAASFSPRNYVCYRTPSHIEIDGNIDTPEWAAAPWSDYFIDIEGDARSIKPRYNTRMKMLWDAEYLYIAAELEEPDIWGYLTERESVIYYDNDFEVFIDPDGDTHKYIEYEMNALATEWDLLLTKPYRDHGYSVLNNWNIAGVKRAVKIYGTINNPSDKDIKWTVEIAMPIKSITEVGGKAAGGEQWRIDFSRVEWFTESKENRYVKIPNKDTGKSGSGSEDNWVWSAPGIISMHAPELWGYMQFSDNVAGGTPEQFIWDQNEDVKWALRRLYERQRQYNSTYGTYANKIEELKPSEITVKGITFAPEIVSAGSYYEISAPAFNGKTAHITSDGRVWLSTNK